METSRQQPTLALACALVLSGAVVFAAPPPGPTPDEQEKTGDPEDIDALVKVHKANQKEIAHAQFARERGSARVRSYAQRLIKDHEDADHKVLTLLRERGKTEEDIGLDLYGERATPGRENEAREQHPSNRFYTARGTEFDQEYLVMMIDQHDDAIAVVREARGRTRDTEVKSFYSKLLPQLERHKREAMELQSGQGRLQQVDTKIRELERP